MVLLWMVVIGKMSYEFRIPTCAQIVFGNKESWLSDWHSLDMLLQMQATYGIIWKERYILATLISDIAQRLRELNLRYNGFDWI